MCLQKSQLSILPSLHHRLLMLLILLVIVTYFYYYHYYYYYYYCYYYYYYCYYYVGNSRSGKNWVGPIQHFPAEMDRRISTGPLLMVRRARLPVSIRLNVGLSQLLLLLLWMLNLFFLNFNHGC